MELLRLVLLVLHLLGFAALLGGLIAQVREPVKRAGPLVRDGSWIAVGAGVALVVVIDQLRDPDAGWYAKAAVKLAVGLVIVALVLVGRHRGRLSPALWASLLALTVADLAVAVLWHPAHSTF